ncbi:uncharacterized protein LOC120149759 [Hibiscus syriacus]|uniref:uncharacterized protein LOC120149759 n=1 Tax=Hibiscus syriacus TaxID=106335 RepID=UPI0019210C0D|nr:uncharacterized protein LOC120149759 [Hibiscus syriacus]
MGLPCSYLALLFQILLLTSGLGIYAVKDLREKQGDDAYYHDTRNAVKDFPQLIKNLEDKYSSISSIEKNPELSSQLTKELEDIYSSISGWKPSLEKNHDLSSPLTKKIEDKYYSISSVEKNPELSSQLTKELEDIYSTISGWKPSLEKNHDSSSQLTKKN